MAFLNLDLNKVPHAKIVALVLLLFSSVIMPFFIMAQFKELERYLNMDWWKVLFLCAGVGFPVFLYLFFLQVLHDGVVERTVKFIQAISWTALNTIMFFIFPLIFYKLDEPKVMAYDSYLLFFKWEFVIFAAFMIFNTIMDAIAAHKSEKHKKQLENVAPRKTDDRWWKKRSTVTEEQD